MFLDTLHEVNRLVQQQLNAARMNVQHLQPQDLCLSTMEFGKPDHSTITVAVPTHLFNLRLDSHSCSTPRDFANKIVKFVLDTANEFSKPRILMSQAYLNYTPRLGLNPSAVVSFDIAMWEYDGKEVHWLEMSALDPERRGHSVGYANSPRPEVATQKHELLKTDPIEINIWAPNIVRDIGRLVSGDDSALQYMIKLEQELLNGARAAAAALNKMQSAAAVHDVVLALFRAKKYDEAAAVLSKALNIDVTIHTAGFNYLMIDDRLYTSDKVFALVAGLEVEYLSPYDIGEQDDPNEGSCANASLIRDSHEALINNLTPEQEMQVDLAFTPNRPRLKGNEVP